MAVRRAAAALEVSRGPDADVSSCSREVAKLRCRGAAVTTTSRSSWRSHLSSPHRQMLCGSYDCEENMMTITDNRLACRRTAERLPQGYLPYNEEWDAVRRSTWASNFGSMIAKADKPDRHRARRQMPCVAFSATHPNVQEQGTRE